MKSSIVLIIAGFAVASATAAMAQVTAPDYLDVNRAAYRAYDSYGHVNGVIVNGRCNGISYGTGARSCGTASGGPVGGISGRN